MEVTEDRKGQVLQLGSLQGRVPGVRGLDVWSFE